VTDRSPHPHHLSSPSTHNAPRPPGRARRGGRWRSRRRRSTPPAPWGSGAPGGGYPPPLPPPGRGGIGAPPRPPILGRPAGGAPLPRGGPRGAGAVALFLDALVALVVEDLDEPNVVLPALRVPRPRGAPRGGRGEGGPLTLEKTQAGPPRRPSEANATGPLLDHTFGALSRLPPGYRKPGLPVEGGSPLGAPRACPPSPGSTAPGPPA